MRILLAIGAAAALMGIAASADASINYNASKSNTGNVAAADTHHGIATGRRRHRHVHHKPEATTPIDSGHGMSTGRRQH